MERVKMMLLLSCWISAAAAVEKLPPLYVVKGGSTCLAAEETPINNTEDVIWTFERKVMVHKGVVIPDFRGRVDFHQVNLSLCVRDLQDGDSGSYQMTGIRTDVLEKISRTHHVVVEGLLPPPIISTQPLWSNASGGGACRVLVNCSVFDQWVTSQCEEVGCSPSQRSAGGFNLSVDATNSTLRCAAANHVSHTSALQTLRCSDRVPSKVPGSPVAPWAVCLGVLALAAAGGVTVMAYMRRRRPAGDEDPIQQVPQERPPGPPVQDAPAPASPQADTLSTTYSLVGPALQRCTPPPPPPPPPPSSTTHHNTTYSQVGRRVK